MRPLLLASVALLLFSPTALIGDEGRVPVYQPSVITQPGSYILTRSIDVTGGNVLTIQANDVTLDLNGQVISSSAPTGTLILIDSGFTRVRILNGRLLGGQVGIQSSSSPPFAEADLRFERLEILNTQASAIDIFRGRFVEMVSCVIANVASDPSSWGVQLLNNSSNDSIAGRIVGNAFIDVDRGLRITRYRNVQIINNSFRNVGTAVSLNSTTSSDNGASLLERNTFRGLGGTSGSAIALLGGDNNLVLDNVIQGFAFGISVLSVVSSSNGNRLVGNIVSGGVEGIRIDSSSRHLIENNRIDGQSTCGLRFTSGSNDNAYRDNMLRGNPGGAVCDAGSGNTDNGGNIL